MGLWQVHKNKKVKSELRLLLKDEFETIAESMKVMENKARDFWMYPDKPSFSVWANFPVLKEIPEPPVGSVSEQFLYYHLMSVVKPALESRKFGFDTVPVIYGHQKHWKGPDFGTHFLAGVMGAECFFPEGLPADKKIGWNSWVKPLINDVEDIDALEEIDVSKSPLLRAVLRGYEEMSEIVQGRIPFTHCSPTLPFEFAADIIGHIKFFELVALNPDAIWQLLDVCRRKWLEMMRLQEKAAGGRWASHNYEPGIRVNDMILSFLSPESIRRIVLPYNEKMSESYGGIVVDIGHRDVSLLGDYLQLTGLRGCSVPLDWSTQQSVVEGLKGKGVLCAGFNWHYHNGQQKWAPVCRRWEECCQHLAQFAGKLRVFVNLYCRGDNPEQSRDGILRDLKDLRSIWEGAENEI
jgi:hypothetical protein